MHFTNLVRFCDGNALNRAKASLVKVIHPLTLKSALLTFCSLSIVSLANAQAPVPPFRQCPAAGLDTSCRILIVYNADGSRRIYTDPNVSATYDGSDDTLIGVVNNSPNPISAVPRTLTELVPFLASMETEFVQPLSRLTPLVAPPAMKGPE